MTKLLEHFKRMQTACAAYVCPEPYTTHIPGATPVTHDDGDKAARDDIFINDMIYMLDGPEQREAQAEPVVALNEHGWHLPSVNEGLRIARVCNGLSVPGDMDLNDPHAYPTMDAYLAVCRALNWRTAELRHAGIEPIDLSKVEDVTHYPPDGFKFPALDLDKRLVRALSSGKVRRSLRRALARGYAGQRHEDDDTLAPEGVYYACRLYDDDFLGAYAGVAEPDGGAITCEVTPDSVVGGTQEACMIIAEQIAAAMNAARA